jgi:hypothetical protein
MKAFTFILIILISSSAFAQEPFPPDTNRVKSDSLIADFLQKETEVKFKKPNFVKRLFDDFDEFRIGGRVNFAQGKYAYLGLAVPFTWNAMYGWPILHIGITPGMDINLSGSTTIYVPKISIEYQYLIGVARIGYQYFTDFSSRHENRLFLEAGLTFFSFFDITYLHSFGFDGNPFRQGSGYFNLTFTLPIYRDK